MILVGAQRAVPLFLQSNPPLFSKNARGLGEGGFAFNFQFVDTLPYLRYP
ncbi:hypothetical protein SDC9_164353 [bioreactor metagenome]|uniref:Uncharacterized protein n=1 Tax=bioreactor metagenome TaxID=1076179 RepID=A0A645FYP1_9ZZZZ